MDPTSTPSCGSRWTSFDCRIMQFVDVDTKECIERVRDKEVEGASGG